MDNQISILTVSSCRFCQSQRTAKTRGQRGIIFENRLFHFMKCKDCRSFFLIPELQEHELEKLYSREYTECNQGLDLSDAYESKFPEIKEFLELQNTNEDSIFLDYGCGANSLPIIYARRAGFQALGMEYDSEVRKIAGRNTQSEILSRNEVENFEGEFSVIFLGDVLEHLNDPFEELAMLESKLSSNGVIYIQGPLQGAGTLLHKFIGLYSFLLPKKLSSFPPYHVNLFTLKGIRILAKRSKLEIRTYKVKEVTWPAPTWRELRMNPKPRSLLLFLLKRIDSLISKFSEQYGTRINLVAEKSDLGTPRNSSNRSSS